MDSDHLQSYTPPTDVIESEEIIQYFHPSLLSVNYDDPQVKMNIAAGTFLFFSVVFLSSYLFSGCFNFFRSMSTKHKVFMSLAVVRGAYGFCCIFLGTYSTFWTTNLDRDVVFGRNATTAFAIYFTVGFFIFELGAVIVSDIVFKTFSKMLITHHGLALIAYGLAAHMNANFSFGCKALLLEMSTPFSCLCFVLLKAGMERSIWWKANQLILVHTFHLRSVVECHIWYITYCHWANIWANMPLAIFVLLYSNLVLVTFVMTPYWGYKKTQQLFNPVDWNFQESRNTTQLNNGQLKKSA